jgi:hypothetical protein
VWARLAQLMVLASAAAQIVALHAVSTELSLVRRVVADPGLFSPADALNKVHHDYRVFQAWTAVLFVLLLGAGACFIVWLYRLRADVDAFTPHRGGLSRGWAIGGWFIPLANVVLPFLVIRDVIRNTSPAVPGGQPARGAPAVYALAALWWALWVVGGVGTRLVHVPSGATPSQLSHALGQLQVLATVEAVAAVLAVAVIEVLTRANRRRWAAGYSAVPSWTGGPTPWAG